MMSLIAVDDRQAASRRYRCREFGLLLPAASALPLTGVLPAATGNRFYEETK